jgi:hypothetical protein
MFIDLLCQGGEVVNKKSDSLKSLFVVAGTGFEPMTFGL